jgi:hypothetical protein
MSLKIYGAQFDVLSWVKTHLDGPNPWLFFKTSMQWSSVASKGWQVHDYSWGHRLKPNNTK